MKKVIFISGFSDEVAHKIEDELNAGAEILSISSNFVSEPPRQIATGGDALITIRPVTIALLVKVEAAREAEL